jgi:hypothetical protein
MNDPEAQGWGSFSNSFCLEKVDPLEAHRLAIQRHLLEFNLVLKDDAEWLSSINLRRFIFAYFQNFHPYLRFLHIPTWSVANSPTTLIFAMALVGSSYTQNLAIGAVKNLKRAYRLVPHAIDMIKHDISASPYGKPSLESIQAMYVLTIFRTFYIGVDGACEVRHRNLEYIELVRKAGLFLPSSERPETWESWIHEEKRKR